MNKTELSVILPVYNGMPYLPAALDSIISQTFQHFVVLVIDNGSTDSTAEYMKSISDDRVIYFYLEDNNLVNALNFGLSKVETEFIARMDADDISKTTRFEEQISYLKMNEKVGLVGTQGKYFGDKKRRFINIKLPTDHEHIADTMLKSRHAIIHPSIMFRKSIIEGESYNEKFYPCEDYELFLRLSNKTKLANLPLLLYNFRIRKDSIVGENIKKSIAMYYKISQQYSPRRNEKNSNSFFQKIDLQAIYYYRKGLDFYLNRSAILGIIYFFISALLSPSRLLNRIKIFITS